jgi:uncharacterized protein YjbJ (UPF0337 family)
MPPRPPIGPPECTTAAGGILTSKMKESDVRSAREDRIRGDIDKMAARVLEAFGKMTGNRSTRAKGRAAHARGVGRTVKGRLKRHAR